MIPNGLRCWARLLVTAALLAVMPVGVAGGGRLALVIGNSAYAEGALANPVNDATDFAAKLRGLGFQVELLLNADQRAMEEAIDTFTRALTGPGKVGLFYFAGHGIEYQGRNYLLPIGAILNGAVDLRYKAVDAGRVLDGMGESGNGLNMVVLDACRNNPFPSTFRSASRGLARLSPAKGTLVLYATQPGAVASDGDGRNGVFTKHLLSAMDEPGLEVEQAFKRAALAVDQETGGAQTPWIEGVVLGQFAFRPSRVALRPTVGAPVTAASDNPQFELEFWNSVKNSDDPTDFQAYLAKYPQGQFQELALRRINRLQVAGIPSPPAFATTTGDLVIKPKLYALVAGVSDYANDSLDLTYAAKDAKDFGAALERQSGGIYREVVVRILENPTSDELLHGLEWLRQEVTSKDVALLFISGHGANDPDGDYYFLTRNSDPERLRRTAVSSFDVKKTLSSLPSKVLAFVDTCHSGNINSGNIMGARRGEVANITGVINDLTAAESGVVVFASSTGKQYSLENPKWGNGAFVKALVEGLDGAASYTKDGIITINQLDLYLRERVKALTGNKQTPITTKPQTIRDFPIALETV